MARILPENERVKEKAKRSPGTNRIRSLATRMNLRWMVVDGAALRLLKGFKPCPAISPIHAAGMLCQKHRTLYCTHEPTHKCIRIIDILVFFYYYR